MNNDHVCATWMSRTVFVACFFIIVVMVYVVHVMHEDGLTQDLHVKC